MRCKQCSRIIISEIPEQDLCDECIENIIATHGRPNDESESIAIIEDVMTCLNDDSEVQVLLRSPGVALALARLQTVTNEPMMMALNSFRMGAYLAFKQRDIEKIIQ